MSSGNDNDLFKSAEDAQRLAAAANAMMTDYSCTHWAQLAGGALSPNTSLYLALYKRHLFYTSIFLNCRYYKFRLNIILHI